ncbi:MAG: hypothetical protein WCR12_02020 [Dysgonamonadaceae bacterium]
MNRKDPAPNNHLNSYSDWRLIKKETPINAIPINPIIQEYAIVLKRVQKIIAAKAGSNIQMNGNLSLFKTLIGYQM